MKRQTQALLAAVLAGAIGSIAPMAQAAEHELKPSPTTVRWGHFSAAVPPVLTINSGDIVALETIAAWDPAIIDRSGVVPPSAVPEHTREIYREVKDRGPGPHVLTGPIAITGAMPGDVLEVRILDVQLAIPYGFNVQRPYAGALPDQFTALWQRTLPIDMVAKTSRILPGVVVPVDRPFFGTMGVAPDITQGRINSGPPGVHAGNLDNKDLVAGTTLYLPVHAPGALFSVGDSHAAQGHGEVDLTAIETGLKGRFQFIVRKDMKLIWPRAETPTHWIAMGLNPDLDEAAKLAVRETIDFITQKFPRITREEAYMIASVAVDYHVTQIVDGTKGVHGMIPKSIFTNN